MNNVYHKVNHRLLARACLLLAGGTLLAGCAAAPPPKNAQDMKRYSSTVVTTTSNKATRKSKDDYLGCELVRPLGSHISRWECLTEEERVRAAQNAQDTMHDLTRGQGRSNQDPAGP